MKEVDSMTNEKSAKEPAQNNNAVDLGGIMKLAGSLFKDADIMNAVSGIMKNADTTSAGSTKPVPGAAGKEKDEQLLLKEIEDLKQEISEMKSQLSLITKQNEALLEIMQKTNEKKSMFSLFSRFR